MLKFSITSRLTERGIKVFERQTFLNCINASFHVTKYNNSIPNSFFDKLGYYNPQAITQCISPYWMVPRCNCQRWAECILSMGHNLEYLVSFKWGYLFVNWFFLLVITFSWKINWGYWLIGFWFYYSWTDYKWLKGNSVIFLICGGGKTNGEFSDK